MAGHAGNANYFLLGAIDQDQRHLKEQFDLGLDSVLVAVVEKLGTITALQKECIAKSYLTQFVLQLSDLTGCNDRWETVQLVDSLCKGLLIIVCNVLNDGLCPPAL